MKTWLSIMALSFVLTISVHAQTDGDSIVPADVPSVKPVIVLQAPKTLDSSYTQYYVMVATEFQDAPVMVKIAAAESSFNPTNKNPYSSARGLFQILTSTWKMYKCTGSVLNATDNINCARKIYENEGTVPWTASMNNWSKA